jgi:cell division protein FtsW
VVGWIVSQAFINIAAITALIPLTGVPLPFISYGGTSLVFLMAAVGILLNISKQARMD